MTNGERAPSDLKSKLWRLLSHDAAHFVALIFLFYVSRKNVFGSLTVVPSSVFDAPSFILASSISSGLHIWTSLLALGVLIWKFRSKYTGTKDDKSALCVRVVVVTCFSLLTFYFCLKQANYYHDSYFVFDRIIAIALFIGVCFRPAFIPALTYVVMLSLTPQTKGIRALNWTEVRLVADMIFMICLWYLLYRRAEGRPRVFVSLHLALVGGAYLVPAWKKMVIGPKVTTWIFENHLENLMVISHLNGWLAKMPTDDWVAISNFVGSVGIAIAIFTFIVEVSGITLAFLGRRGAWLMLLFALFHLGVFATSGIFFWKWMFVEFGLAIAMFKAPPSWFQFSLVHRLLLLVCIVFSRPILKPASLGWFDTPFDQAIEIHVVGKSGNRYEVPPKFFAPYDIFFCQNRAIQYFDEPRATGTYGAAFSYGELKKLERANSHKKLLKYARDIGRAVPAKAHRKTLNGFLKTFFTHTNKTIGAFRFGFSPSHIFQSTKGPDYDFQEEVTRIEIEFVEFGLVKGKTKEYTRRIVEVIGLPKGRVQKTKTVKKKPKKKKKLQARDKSNPRGEPFVFEPPASGGKKLTIGAVGDIVAYSSNHRQGFSEGFEHLWEPFIPFVKSVDVAYGNFEGTTSCCLDAKGNKRKNPGKRFDNKVYTASNAGLNYHPALVDALKKTGFDVLSTANNHSLDRSKKGVFDTLDKINATGMVPVGTRKSTDSNWLKVIDKKGFKLGFIACTEWTNKKRNSGEPYVLNCRKDEKTILELIRKVSSSKAIDAVVFTPHGGVETTATSDKRMRQLSQAAVKAGALLVFSGHPHHTQNAETLQGPKGKAFISYSRGNFLTYSRAIEARASVFDVVTLEKNDRGTQIKSVVWVPLILKEEQSGKHLYRQVTPVAKKSSHRDEERALDWLSSRRPLGNRVMGIDYLKGKGADAQKRHRAGVGSGCDADAQCEEGLTCFDDYWDGFCSKSCEKDCPNDSRCIALDGDFYCALACTDKGQCRALEECSAAAHREGAKTKVCLPTRVPSRAK